MKTQRKVATKEAKPTLSRVLQKRIKGLGDAWQLDEKQKKLTPTYSFPRYLDGFMFATRISVHAEVLDHHPELCISYNKVKIILMTHDAGCVTDLDIDLAERINQIISTRN